jgi:hypothetical protein
MSGPAMHRVLVNGPDDHVLFRVLMAVADWPDTDHDQAGHPVSQHVVATRARISLRWCREVMAQAVADGWLAQPGKPRPGRPGLWKIGPKCAEVRGGTAHPVPNRTELPRTTARSPRTKMHIDGDVDDVRKPPPLDGAGGGSPAGHADGAVRGSSAAQTDVPPAPPETVDKPAALEYLRAAHAHLTGLRPPSPPEPEPLLAPPSATVLAFKPKGHP